EIDAIESLIDRPDMPRRYERSVGSLARHRIREREDAADVPAEPLERTREEPGLAVPRNFIQEHEPPELDGVRRPAGEDAREDLVAAGMGEDGNAGEIAAIVETEAEACG